MQTPQKIWDESSNQRSISYEELKKHSAYSDGWIAINGIVYDITNYISKHPFGDTFRGNLGTDCTGLFSSAHLHTNVEELLQQETFLKNNDIVIVGTLTPENANLHAESDDKFLDRLVYHSTQEDKFWLDLKQRVKAYLAEIEESTHYSTKEGILLLLYHGSLFLILSYFTWIKLSFIAAILLSAHMVCASASMSHMAAHFGLTNNQKLNFLALQFMDLSGFSSLEWQIIHQTHHNQPHSSIDHQTNQYVPLRIHEYVRWEPYHKYQNRYWLIALPIFHFRSFFMSTVWLLQYRNFVRYPREVIAHLISKTTVVSLIAYCGYQYGLFNTGLIFMLYSTAFSFFAFLLLYNNHEETHHVLALQENINPLHKKFPWAEIQVRTSGNWVPTNWLLSFVEFHYGYFNYHIEHHLFPSFKPALLKKLSPIVKQTCLDHKIPYLSTTFMEVQISFYWHLTHMGKPKST
ncbi:MAG: fatty acid desaturase [Cyanophyceae cyanobacterium]